MVVDRLPSNAVGIGGRPEGGEQDVMRVSGEGNVSAERAVSVEWRGGGNAGAFSSLDTNGTSASEYRTSSISLSSAHRRLTSSDLFLTLSGSCSTDTLAWFPSGLGFLRRLRNGNKWHGASFSLSSCLVTSRLTDAGVNPQGASRVACPHRPLGCNRRFILLAFD